jgi:DNA modification methylase
MKIEQIATDKLIPYARNAKKHDAAQVSKLAGSIREFGFNNPVLIDKDNGIIAGHGRVMAAQSLSLESVPCIRLGHLTDSQRRAYILADNRLAEIGGGWDEEMLKLELSELGDLDVDLEAIGFGAEDLAEMEMEEVTGNTDPDEVPEPPVDPVTVIGDVWVMGKHRVMCGDSTSIDAVDGLMDGQKADMVFTDPPYNIDYQGVKDRREKIKNDKMSDSDFLDFLMQSLMPCEVMYVCCSWQYAHLFKQAMQDMGHAAKAMIVWDKVNPAQHLDLYFKQHEIIFYHGPFGGNKTVRGDVWQIKRQQNTVHPTMKPIELIEMALSDHPGKKIVYDSFGGSGSTLIACEKTNRHAHLMELDPKYCDVIVNRWQDFTGKKAIHESSGKTFDEMKAAKP